MDHLYRTDAMLGAIRSLKRPKPWILETYFPLVQTEESEEIHFDVEIGKRKLAPFVAPTAQGVIVERNGFQTNTFRPAYIKQKTPLRPGAALRRAMGEQLGGGQLTAAQRQAANLAQTLYDHVDRITRRLNHMATEALVSGTVTVKGEGYAPHVVNFGRSSDLSIALTGVDKWDDEDADPIRDIEEAIELVHEIEGASIYRVTMDPVAWRLFKANRRVQAILDNRRAAGANTAEFGGLDLAKGAQFGGTFGSFEVWIYSEFYEDPDTGETKPVLPAGTVIGASDDMQGVRAFGAIHDEEAGIQALEFFPKSWVEKDPGVRFVMTQSAPLVVPTRPNASFCMTVI